MVWRPFCIMDDIQTSKFSMLRSVQEAMATRMRILILVKREAILILASGFQLWRAIISGGEYPYRTPPYSILCVLPFFALLCFTALKFVDQ